jgi:hypothetical protein
LSFKSLDSYRKFRKSVITNQRYILDEDSKKFLKSIKDTCEHRIKSIPISQSLCRAQIGCDYIPIIENDIKVDEEPTPFEDKRMKPTVDFASEGRSNPKGIVYLYVAEDKDTAVSEVRPSLGEILSIGELNSNKELKIIDFSKHNGKFFVINPSQNDINEAAWRDMDKAFSIPVKNNDFNSDYVPTQIIAEFIKSLGYDGIAYKSSLAQGKNITLFDLDSTTISNVNIFKLKKINYEFDKELNQYTNNG